MRNQRKNISAAHGDGSIRARGPGQFEARITINGRSYSQTHGSAEAARSYLDALVEAAREPDRVEKIADARKLSLAKALRNRLRIRTSLKSDQKPETDFLIKTFPAFCGKAMYAIDELDIEAFIDERTRLGASPATVNKSLSIISNTFNLARTKMGCVALRNPIGPTTWLAEPRGRVRRLSREEEAALLRAAAAYEAMSSVQISKVILFACGTAMRLSEITGMRWEHVDLEKGTVFLSDTKNGESRSVPLGLVLRTLLRELGPRSEGPVWGKREAVRTAWKRVRAAAARTAQQENNERLAASLLTFRFHDLRHEGTSRLIERTGWENARIKAVTGHKTDSMLARYTHLRAGDLADELALLEGGKKGGARKAQRYASPEVPEPPQNIQQRARWRAVSTSKDLLSMLVQAKSLRAIGAEYGVSDVAVHKACERLQVQKQPRGYW